MPKAAIFDLDGTLVDLFETHLEGFQRIIRRDYDLEFTEEDLIKGYGEKGEDIVRMFFEKHNVSGVDYGKLSRERAELVEEIMDRNVKVMPGVKRLLEELRERGMRIGLGTSARKGLTEKVLELGGIRGYFEALTAGDEMERGKPEPDIFLDVARKLGVGAEDCVVFEDSPFGVEAGKAAGMKVIAVATGKSSMDELSEFGPDAVVNSLRDVDVESLFNEGD